MNDQESDLLRRQVHEAIRKVLSDPHPFVRILTRAPSLTQAATAIANYYELDLTLAETVILQRFQLLIPSERESLDS